MEKFRVLAGAMRGQGGSRRPRTGFKVLILHLLTSDLGQPLNPMSFGFYTLKMRMLIISDTVRVKIIYCNSPL